jgi:hypothetical protein
MKQSRKGVSERALAMQKVLLQPLPFREKVCNAAAWWKVNFTIAPLVGGDPQSTGKQGVKDEDYFIERLKDMSGTEEDYCVLLVCLYRSLGLECRMVGSLQPIPLKMTTNKSTLMHSLSVCSSALNGRGSKRCSSGIAFR